MLGGGGGNNYLILNIGHLLHRNLLVRWRDQPEDEEGAIPSAEDVRD